MYPYIIIGGSYLSVFNLCIAFGGLLSLLLFERHARRIYPPADVDMLLTITGLTIPWGFFGGIVFDKCMHYHELMPEQKSLFVYTGMSFLGGLIFAAITFTALYGILFRSFQKYWFHLNLIVPYVALGHMFGRIGCFFGGCCYGKPSNSILAVQFPAESPAVRKYGMVPVLPTQLMEAGLLFLIFFIVRNRKQKVKIYGEIYTIGRFILEFFRGDDRGRIGNTILYSPSQVVCLLILLLIFLHTGYRIASQKTGWKL